MNDCHEKMFMSKPIMARGFIVLLAVCLVSSAILFLGFKVKDGLTHFRSYDRYITVKGLATKSVEADVAVWSITFNSAAETLSDAQSALGISEKNVRDYLVAQGLAAEEIRLQNISVVDRKAQIYGNGGASELRYVLTQTVVARTGNIAAMIKASQNVSELVKLGVALSDDGGAQYLFTKLNDIKPALIAEATRNARVSAEQFAQDSGQKVGEIRTANQGTIQIESRDPGIPESQNPQKSVRVVTTIEYLLGK